MTAPASPTAPNDQAPQGDQPTDQPTPTEYTPPATQAELDRIITERVNRTKNQFKDYAELKKAADELAQIRAANQTEAQRLTEEATRWQTEAEKWRGAAVGNRVQALASVDFADPSDAVAALGTDLSKYLDAGGQIDENAIRTDLADVLERKPHWRRQEGTPAPRVPAPNPAQGSSGHPPAADPGAAFAAVIQGQMNGPR